MQKSSAWRKAFATSVVGAVILAGCGSDGDDAASDDTTTTAAGVEATTTAAGTEPAGATVEISAEDKEAVATTYADVVFAAYDASVISAKELQGSIEAFLAAPSAAGLDAARQAWLDARDIYGPTEVFRFYDGPIDNAEDGPEGQINAWPLDESYIDSIVADSEGYPELTTDVLVEANEEGGETNISTGWHAIEYLLWGADESDDGPGAREFTDYTDDADAERRSTYLTLLADLLVQDLTGVRDQWDPTSGEYRTEFVADADAAIANILRGMGALSSGELAGERMAVPYETKDQEDEHSCFSDNTLADIVGNAKGIQLAYTAEYEGVDGTSLSDAVAAADPELDAALTKTLADNVAAAEALVGPFDRIIQADDDDPERVALDELIKSLQDQGDEIAELATALGYSISISID